jgi:hypothetical protein
MDRKRIAGGALTLAGTALAGEWIVRGADMLLSFFYEAGTVDWAAVRATVGLVALVVGIVLFFRPASNAKENTELERLCNLAKTIAIDIEALTDAARPRIRGEIVSLYVGMGKLGFATPDAEANDLELVLRRAKHFIAAILPMMREGHIAEARQRSSALAQRAEKAIPPNFRRVV